MVATDFTGINRMNVQFGGNVACELIFFDDKNLTISLEEGFELMRSKDK